MGTPRVLILADDCNPEWPSLPIVGYKYARSLAAVADVTVATHVRNRENIEKAGDLGAPVRYIDTEWIAGPMYRLATWLRRDKETGWSVKLMMGYLPYLAFERQALREFRDPLRAGAFDLVHRITPMSPTLPSYAAGRTHQPFVLGPLNGNLDWPAAYKSEQLRERERLRGLRRFARAVPFAGSTYARAAAILAAFDHTVAGVPEAARSRVVSFPEVGYDPAIFHDEGRAPPFAGIGPYRFAYVGRLVPYKLPEAAIRAFATSKALEPHRLHIIGDGPERVRLEAIVAELGASERVIFEGRRSQAEVADALRAADAFVFPSIRELGAGVVVEAMACGPVSIVVDYGAPGDLIGRDRGIAIPLAPLDELTEKLRDAMEVAAAQPERHRALAAAARDYVQRYYDWDTKAAFTRRIYNAILSGAPLSELTDYA